MNSRCRPDLAVHPLATRLAISVEQIVIARHGHEGYPTALERGDLGMEPDPLGSEDLEVVGVAFDHVANLDNEGGEQVDDLVDDLIELVGKMKLTVTEYDESEFVLRLRRRLNRCCS